MQHWSSEVCLPFSTWLDWDTGFWEEDHKSKMHSHHTSPRVHSIHMTYHCWGWLWSIGWSNVCQVHCKVSLSPFVHCSVWKEITKQPAFMKQGIMLCLPEVKGESIYMIYLTFFYTENLFTLLIHWFIYLLNIIKSSLISFWTH